MSYYVPVAERNGRQYDIFSLLLKDRIVFVGGQIDDVLANSVVAQLLLLEAEDPTAEINVYINSAGGSISAGMAIYDTIRYIKAPVHTIGLGLAASMASLLLAAGDRRSVLEHTKVMIHQPLISGDFGGKETDISIIARELTATRKIVAGLLAKHSKKPLEVVEADIENDRYMTAEEACEYGICDNVIKENDV